MSAAPATQERNWSHWKTSVWLRQRQNFIFIFRKLKMFIDKNLSLDLAQPKFIHLFINEFDTFLFHFTFLLWMNLRIHKSMRNSLTKRCVAHNSSLLFIPFWTGSHQWAARQIAIKTEHHHNKLNTIRMPLLLFHSFTNEIRKIGWGKGERQKNNNFIYLFYSFFLFLYKNKKIKKNEIYRIFIHRNISQCLLSLVCYSKCYAFTFFLNYFNDSSWIKTNASAKSRLNDVEVEIFSVQN